MRFAIHALDWLVFVLAGWLAYGLRFGEEQGDMPDVYELLILQMSTVMLLAASAVYRAWRGGLLRALVGRAALSWLITWAVLMGYLVLSKTSTDFSRIWLGAWALTSLMGIVMSRLGLYGVMRWLRGKSIQHKSVLVVGGGNPQQAIEQRMQNSAWTGFQLAAKASLQDLDGVKSAIAKVNPDEVWLCPPANNMGGVQEVLEALRFSTANIRMVPDMGAFQLVNNGVTLVLGFPMVDISNSPMSGFNQLLKWVEDKVLGALILLLISPLMLLIAIAIKCTSPGPIIFKQKRHGWNGETIWVYKFRSMFVHHEDGVTQARKGDTRITPLGHFLRASSLDELPQFINVVQGNMSIVGPRPHAVEHNLQYREQIPKYMLRNKMKPGITGWAQINGLRGETDTLDKMEARVVADLYYLENWSLILDLKIIILTIFKGFFGKNAY